MNILIVETTLLQRERIDRAFRGLVRQEIHHASPGTEAESIFRQHLLGKDLPIVVIHLDPLEASLDMVKAIRSLESQEGQDPSHILGLSDYDQAHVETLGRMVGVDSFLPQPLNPELLVKTLRRQLGDDSVLRVEDILP